MFLLALPQLLMIGIQMIGIRQRSKTRISQMERKRKRFNDKVLRKEKPFLLSVLDPLLFSRSLQNTLFSSSSINMLHTLFHMGSTFLYMCEYFMQRNVQLFFSFS